MRHLDSHPPRIDVDALKRTHPVEDVVARYGVELRRSGAALVGRCPLHQDAGRPNFHAYPATGTWYCYRCNVGGDVIRLVERVEQVGFRDAIARLGGSLHGPMSPRPRRSHEKPTRAPARTLGPGEQACLAAAVELYHNCLLADPSALAYVEGRGLTRATIEAHRLGYAAGGELAGYLRWRRLPLGAALRAGLLGADGREVLAGRVIVPELRAGGPVWLVGRALASETDPKYLGLAGRKPLLGWEAAADSTTVVVTEGPFDWLTLRQWGVPALALVGTHVRPEALAALTRFRRVYLALDGDEPGRAAARALCEALGQPAVPIALPPCAKDISELACLPDGECLFAGAVLEADRAARTR